MCARGDDCACNYITRRCRAGTSAGRFKIALARRLELASSVRPRDALRRHDGLTTRTTWPDAGQREADRGGARRRPHGHGRCGARRPEGRFDRAGAGERSRPAGAGERSGAGAGQRTRRAGAEQWSRGAGEGSRPQGPASAGEGQGSPEKPAEAPPAQPPQGGGRPRRRAEARPEAVVATADGLPRARPVGRVRASPAAATASRPRAEALRRSRSAGASGDEPLPAAASRTPPGAQRPAGPRDGGIATRLEATAALRRESRRPGRSSVRTRAAATRRSRPTPAASTPRCRSPASRSCCWPGSERCCGWWACGCAARLPDRGEPKDARGAADRPPRVVQGRSPRAFGPACSS